jgi:hypothetical protein
LSRDSVVGIMTRLWAGPFELQRGQEIYLFSENVIPWLGPHSAWYWRRREEFATHHHLVPSLRMSALYLHSPTAFMANTFIFQSVCRRFDILSINVGRNYMFAVVNWFVYIKWRTWIVPICVDGGTRDVGFVALCVTSVDQSPSLEIAVSVYHTVLVRENPLSASRCQSAVWISSSP